MTRDEAVALIQTRLGYYEKKTDSVITEMKFQQGRLESGVNLNGLGTWRGTFKPWFLVSEMQSVLTTIKEERLAVPAPYAGLAPSGLGAHGGFIGEVENAALWLLDPDAPEEGDPLIDDEVTATMTELIKMPYDEVRAVYPGTGAPKAYDLVGRYFRLGPIPDKQYTIRIISHNADVFPATGDATNKWLTYAPGMIIGKAGAAMAASLRDAVALKEFNTMLAEETLNLFIATEERLHTNRRIVMGEAD